MSTRHKALFAILAAGAFGGVGPVLMKFALKEFSPFEIIFIRSFGAFLILFFLGLFTKRLHYPTKDIYKLLFISIFFVANILLFIVGLQFTTSIASQLLYLLTPTFVIILSTILLKHTFQKKHFISIIAGFAGGLILIFRSNNLPIAQSLGNMKGNGIILVAVCTWALYVVFSKKISTKYSPFSIVTFVNLITGLSALVFVIFLHQDVLASLSHASFWGLFSLLFLIIFNSILFFFLYQFAVKLVKPFSVSISSYISLLFTALFAIPLFGEQITQQLVISALLIIASSYLTFRKK